MVVVSHLFSFLINFRGRYDAYASHLPLLLGTIYFPTAPFTVNPQAIYIKSPCHNLHEIPNTISTKRFFTFSTFLL